MRDLLDKNSILLCGVGQMGTALLQGWLVNGVSPNKIVVSEPNPSEWLLALRSKGLKLNTKLSQIPGICVLAVKPQIVETTIRGLNVSQGISTLFVSVAAGIKLSTLEDYLGKQTRIVRVMPNTPCSIKKGVSCLINNKSCSNADIELVETLFSFISRTLRLSHEDQMDVVTAISGSGPAYVFYLIESLIMAGRNLGLPQDLAEKLAIFTVSGAGALAERSDIPPETLRANVTSPNGTTEAALRVLMNEKDGLSKLISEAVIAAADRSKQLGSKG